MIDAEQVRRRAFDEARRILGDAITYRREHPYAFYRYHAHMATLRRKQGRRLAAFWHRRWREHYEAKSLATAQGGRCIFDHEEE